MQNHVKSVTPGRRRLRGLVAIAATTAVATLIAACSAAAPEDSPGGDDESAVTVTIGVPAVAAFAVPALVAPSLPEFSEEGITVETQVISNPDALVLLAQGKLDAFYGPISAGTFNAVAGGSRLAVVTPGQVTGASQWWVSTAALAKLGKTPEEFELADFKGQPVYSSTGAGSALMAGLAQLIEPAGLVPTDINFAQIKPTDVIPALESGALFAGVPVTEQAAMLEANGAAFPVGSAYPPPMPQFFLQFGSRLLDEEREVGQRVVDAWKKMITTHFQGDYVHDPEFAPVIATALEMTAEQQAKMLSATYDPELSIPEGFPEQVESVWRQVPGTLNYDGSVADKVFDPSFAQKAGS